MPDLSNNPEIIQQIVTSRRAVREELANQILAIIDVMPKGYGLTVESFARQLEARIRTIIPEDDKDA